MLSDLPKAKPSAAPADAPAREDDELATGRSASGVAPSAEATAPGEEPAAAEHKKKRKQKKLNTEDMQYIGDKVGADRLHAVAPHSI